ncbi:5-formyltetrahydrofolate cyclo-ligase [Anditalea andensis]|uniref:5-formyltetrahydrofolate cyclo-ligase n=1 Tax=Anditalea andensis TaxID=1048983 RepID=A0A074KTL5_9BACT|nr:5-formyltetrahydrofolate cyclo-ligase [Anditalea andensis]KEO73311.1 hypothetical protein EL17_13255 [Anditalea andensis]
MERKKELRSLYRTKRKHLSLDEKTKFSLSIAHKVMGFLDAHAHITHVHIFLSIKKLNEIDTLPLIDNLLNKNITLYTSVTDFQMRQMKNVKLGTPLVIMEDEFGIPVPGLIEEAEVDDIQMVLIPLLAYDLEGNRLGYGKGFYDRFLEALPQEVLKAGVSFFPPEKEIPSEIHDIKLDICFTATEVYQF